MPSFGANCVEEQQVLRVRFGAAVRGSPSFRVQREDLEDHVRPWVRGAGERAYLAADDFLDGFDEQSCGGRLQEGPRLAYALVLAHVDHGSLGGQQSVLERADQRVMSGEIGPRMGRAAAELLLVELHQ